MMNFYNLNKQWVPPEVGGPLTVSSVTTDSIVVSWTALQSPPPTGYMLSIDCVLLCGDPLPSPPTTTIITTSTSATFPDIAAGSECEITLITPCRTASSNELTVMATTKSKGE